ncbi:MAG: ABC transporter ATP-binding protein [Rhizobiales bacterium]|nr:ABC transporter ATP-binding protein [Hyphomicrobiales bacterium]
MLYGKLGQRVQVRHLSKSFGKISALRDLTFDVEPGELVAFLGPSGCGKTTALKTIAGLLPGHGGEISFGGERIDHLPPNKRNIGLVFQNYSLFPHMTVSENIGYGLRMRRWPLERRAARIREMLALARLEGLGDRKPGQLSGGQQQRVALVRAMAFMPDLLLLDEPLSNLDAGLREDVRADMRNIQRRTRQTTILVTHDQEEALVMSDRIVLMNQGRVEQIDSPEQLYSMPATEFAARFIGRGNILYGTYLRDGDVDAVRIEGLDAPLSASTKAPAVGPAGSPVAACIQPEQIVVSARNDAETLKSRWPRAFIATGKIVDIAFHGGSSVLHLDVEGAGVLKCRRPATEVQGLRFGDRVAVGILDCHLMPQSE